MEEVDQIILQSLRDIGCEIDDDARLKTLSPEDIYKCLLRLCKCIKSDVEISGHLPAPMAQRFAAASQLVDCCRSLGFNGDLGYQTILYSNPIELRRIFMWLIEHLPKSEDKTDSFHQTREVSKAKSLESEILRKLASDLKRPWVLEFLQPPQNVPVNIVELEKPVIGESMSDDQIEYKRRWQPTIFHQTRALMPSIIATHDIDFIRQKHQQPHLDTALIAQKLRSSTIRPSHSLSLMSSPSRSSMMMSLVSLVERPEEIAEVPEEPKMKTRVEILAEKIELLKEQIEDQENVYRHLTNEKSDQLRAIDEEALKLEQLKKEKKLKMQVAMLLDNPEDSKEKLQQTLAVAMKKREVLNNKFETHKQPLVEHLETFTKVNSEKMRIADERTSCIKAIKQTILDIQGDVRNKVQVQQQLQTELSQIKRITERSAYTQRILEIVKSIKKQNNDINDILKDTKALQKAINTVEGQLQRQFTVTEDLIWNNTTKKDEYSKKIYKLLITLHTDFSELINLIENTGSIQREIRELEDQIDNERQQNVKQKLEQITKDLEMLISSK